jgi:hypothetical protein
MEKKKVTLDLRVPTKINYLLMNIDHYGIVSAVSSV